MNKKNKIILGLIIGIAIIILCTIFALINSFSDKIILGVYIQGIEAHKYTESEMKEKFANKIGEMQCKKIILKYDDNKVEITLNELNVQYDYGNTVTEAYSLGRNKNIILNNFEILKTAIFKKRLNINIKVDEEKINEKIHSLYSIIENSAEEPSYYIEEGKLIIVNGKKGLAINEEELKKEILKEIYNLDQENKEIEIPTYEKEPSKIDIDEIYNEIYREPENASVSEDGKVHPNVDGVDFEITLDEAKELLKEVKEEYEIPLKITKAEVTLQDLGKDAFPEILGTFVTRYNETNENRAKNINLSSEKINGTIVLPGETFSYNKIVGKRTIDAGYAEAGAYAGGKVIQEVGGGICQVSSTLYNAVLYANLEVIERSNHYFKCSYVAPGRDATVSWGGVDFKFKNNRKYPILVEITSQNGICKASIKGIKEDNEYDVLIQSKVQSVESREIKYENDYSIDTGKEIIKQDGSDGCTVDTYKVIQKNGSTISLEKISTDYYHSLEKIIIRGAKQGIADSSKEEEENIMDGLNLNIITNID